MPCAPVDGQGNPVNGVFVPSLGLFIIPAFALYTQLVPNAQLTFNESLTEGRHEVVVDFNNTEGLYVRDLGTIFTWDIQRKTILEVWQPSVIPLDEDLYGRMSFHFLMKSLGITGWGHAREMNIPFQSTADLTLLLSFGAGASPASISLTIPNSGGVETKQKVTLPPNKFKIVECFLSSAAPFKLWGTDLEMKIKQWGTEGPYQVLRPVSG